jgi:hypothetical protein
MNKYLAAIACALFASVSILSSDVIFPGTHYISTDVRIDNINSFPDVAVIAHVYAVMGTVAPYVVEQNMSLYKGYKFNGLKLFAIKKSLLNSAGGIGSLDFTKIETQFTGASIIDPAGIFGYSDNPLKSQSFTYSIAEVTDTSVTLRLTKGVFSFNDGRKDEVVSY